jgi:hypothetical protein
VNTDGDSTNLPATSGSKKLLQNFGEIYISSSQIEMFAKKYF